MRAEKRSPLLGLRLIGLFFGVFVGLNGFIVLFFSSLGGGAQGWRDALVTIGGSGLITATGFLAMYAFFAREMKDYLIVFDAPVSDAQSKWLLDAAKAKFPGKPVKFLVLTHHHMDHAGGLRAYAADGAAIVVGKGGAEHYRRVLAAPFTRNPDLASRDLGRTEIIEVVDKRVWSDGTREVQAVVIEKNPHADGLMFGYVSDVRLGFATDIWSPGAGPLPDKLNPALASLVGAVKKAGISPAKFAGGHGSTADYAPLAALEGK